MSAVAIGVARGCTECTCTPRVEKIFCQIYIGKLLVHLPSRESTPSGGRARVQFLGNWGDLDSGRGYLGSFSVCFDGATTKKVVNFFGEEKCTPDKILATPMAVASQYKETRFQGLRCLNVSLLCYWL